MMRLLKTSALILTATILLLLAAAIWASGGFQSPGSQNERIQVNTLPDTSQWHSSIRVMTWNIGFAHGIGADGPGYSPQPRTFYEDALNEIARVIRESEADIVLLQEIDFGSDRSAQLDQLQILTSATGLPFAVRAESWRARYIPFPYWPVSHHFGKMSSGGAVLSRFPITANDVELLEKPSANGWFYNLFYLFRYHQSVSIEIHGRTFRVINNHLEAFNTENRHDQARNLTRQLTGFTEEILVFGGDLNAVPENAPQRSGFHGSDDDYTGDETLRILREIPGYNELVSPEEYAVDPALWHTFPTNTPNRRLDYLFVDTRYPILSKRVIREAGIVSDHFPVVAEILINNPGGATPGNN